jgi:AraC-like DNA-binding protein
VTGLFFLKNGKTMKSLFQNKLNTYLEQNYSNPDLNIDHICRDLRVSRTKLHNEIKATHNQSTTEYINTFRLKKAKDIMAQGDKNISETAYEVGYEDPNYFSRKFKKLFGDCPSGRSKLKD